MDDKWTLNICEGCEKRDEHLSGLLVGKDVAKDDFDCNIWSSSTVGIVGFYY